MEVLAVIPAAGKHERIPQMNSRFLAGKPLVSYIISSAQKSRYIDDIYISTNSDKISHIAELAGVKKINRPNELAKPNCGLDKVVIDAWERIEDENNKKYDYIITLQPNCPLITSTSIDESISEIAFNFCYDTVISVKNDTGLFWRENNEGFGVKDFSVRKIRKELDDKFKETGGILISERQNLADNQNRIGEKVKLIKLDFREGLEIKRFSDWWIAEKLLKRKKILIRVDGYRKIGLGHIYRTLLLANRLGDHEILFVSKGDYDLGINLIKSKGYDIKTFSVYDQYRDIINNYNPDIVINDILDTSVEYIEDLKEKNIFIVNFEDMGAGAKKADIVINALYNEKYPLDNHYWGKEYYCLREEFYLVDEKEVKEEVEEILITFGGTDSHNYTGRIIELIDDLGLNEIKVNIILGLGYESINDLERKIEKLGLYIEVKQNINNISKYMHQADIVFTSAGRTVYEISSIGTPTIVLAQNNRELRHTFASSENGIINLGLGYEVEDEEIKNTLINLIDDYELRKRCNELMLKNNLKSGINNILDVIFEKYEEFEKAGVK